MAHLYYLTPGETLEAGTGVRLQGDEARHAASVSRLAVGEDILVRDGVGTLATARASAVTPKEIFLDVHDTTTHSRQ